MTKIIISFRVFSNDSFSREKDYQACHLYPHVSTLGTLAQPPSARRCISLRVFSGHLTQLCQVTERINACLEQPSGGRWCIKTPAPALLGTVSFRGKSSPERLCSIYPPWRIA